MAVLAGSSTASEPMRLLLLALLAYAAAGASICDTAICGRGNCTELPELVPGIPIYECHCDPGWSQAWKAVRFSPCIVPNCSFDGTCLNLSLTPPTGIPKDVCAVVSCGAGGACKTGGAALFSYTCECQPGYANLLNQTALPCVKNCSVPSRRLRQLLLLVTLAMAQVM
ncbi:fibropellin-3-like [Setaria italica]|uniref:fibropellin-3-like n=1 Tax=Setaria italica TaxID=4555 RepID=UPI00035117E7|nr:fibropellin-3-like [Setaria italica]